MKSWIDIKAGWASGWQELQQAALDQWGAAIRSKPQDFAPQVKATIDELAAARAHLDRIKPRLPNQIKTAEDQRVFSNFSRMSARYYELAAGVYADAQPASQVQPPAVGAAPLLVVAGVALGLAGIAWAVAAYQYAKNLREQTALADRELGARVEASKEGRTLPPTTLPPPPPKPDASKAGWLLVGGLVLAAGAATVPLLLKKGRS